VLNNTEAFALRPCHLTAGTKFTFHNNLGEKSSCIGQPGRRIWHLSHQERKFTPETQTNPMRLDPKWEKNDVPYQNLPYMRVVACPRQAGRGRHGPACRRGCRGTPRG
jgi:hypothetical protein